MQWLRGNRQHRWKVLGLVAGLFLLGALATAFTVAAMQIQAASTAYVSGESAWSRAQLAAVYHLDAYAESGRSSSLAQAREALAVPLGDRQARLAMEREPVETAVAREGLLQGQNHPDDIGRMIWLYRHFAESPVFREAVRMWRKSDSGILALSELADRLEAEWTAETPSLATIAELRERLGEINQRLDVFAKEFRRAMTDAARRVAQWLTIAGVAILLTLALIAWFLGWWLVRIITTAERKFRTTFEKAAVGMAQMDRQGHLIDVNPALCGILGYPRATLQGQRYWDLVHPEDRDIDRSQREMMLAGNLDSHTLEHRLLCRHSDTVWAKLTLSRMHDGIGSGARYVAILEDVSESRRLSVELSYQANHDALTGLPNRRSFERHLAETLRQTRTDGSTHVLGFIDLDQFKVINDTAGHAAGDQLLCQVADLLLSQLREGDMLARLGGDEFAVILKDCGLPRAQHVTERLRSALEQTSFMWEGATFRPGCSIGVVPITPASVDAGSLQRTADIACYLAKEQGRNRVAVLREDDRQLATQRGEMEWLTRIRSALLERRFFLEAQRLERLDAPGSLRYEVLVRLTDEQGQTVPPGAFLPAAERFGVAPQIDRWVLEEVCTQLAAHPRHLARLEACHINLSGRSFDDEDFSDFVVNTLERYSLPAEKLCFEITETAAASNLTYVTAFMERLGARGCTFALDDFGAGLSSFGYLRRLPVECIKIDGTFVRHMDTDNIDLAMVRAINEVGQTLEKTIVAEFVESEATLALLRRMDVHYAQGFGIHRPCRFDELLADDPSECMG